MQPTTTASTSDRIEKQVTLEAERSRVWRALTDVKQFNSWFGINLMTPFTAGAEVKGSMKYRGADLTVTIWIEDVEPERFFSFRWHPYALEQDVDYSVEPTTLVSFTLTDAGSNTQLDIVESGFDAIPESRRATAFGMNSKGWTGQIENIRKYLAKPQDS
jgi:uncharacterized protein YndB with AHSA1/START domain